VATVNNGVVQAGDSGETITSYVDYPTVLSIYGGAGNDVLRGNSLNNDIRGGAGDDWFWGGAQGADTMTGGYGNDVYWWGNGDASDTLGSTAGGDARDVLYFYNLQLGDYTAWYSGNDLWLRTGGGDTLCWQDWQDADAKTRLQSLVFADKTAYAWNAGQGAEVSLSDSFYERNGIHHLMALDFGDCTLRGGTGADTIEGGRGSDLIWGGVGGKDRLSGGDGADTFYFGNGDGADVVGTSGERYRDSVRVYNANSLTIGQADNDLVLTTAQGDSLTIEDWYADSQHLNRFVFADGTVRRIVNGQWQDVGTDAAGFQIEVDYATYDEQRFFLDHPERQAVVEEACRIWESILADEFEAIQAGTTISVFNPNTRQAETVTLTREIDDFRLYLGSVTLTNSSTLGYSIAAATSNLGNALLDERYNSYDNIEPWVGSIAINTSYADELYFDATPQDELDDQVPAGKLDFLHIMLHEIGHALGFGPQNAGSQYVTSSNGSYYFSGPNVLSVYGGPMPLDFASGTHVAATANQEALMQPSLSTGERVLPTALDKAIFADIGYQIL